MSLPENSNAEWPPAWWKSNQRLIDEARAWLIGSVSNLAQVYGTGQQQSHQAWRQRLANALAGKPADSKQAQTDRLHVPLPRQIARTSASLLFSDGFTFAYPEAEVKVAEGATVPPETQVAQALQAELQEYIEQDAWVSKLWQAGYIGSGEGGIYLLPAWYKGSTTPTMRVVHHNRGIPVFIGGKLVECTVWTVVGKESDGRTVWRHLEVHTPGRVQHALYRGTLDKLGDRKSLGDHRATAGIEADEQDGIFDTTKVGMEKGELLVDYVPNLLPHPVTLDGNIGGSDTAGIEDQLYALDTADSGWEADVRVGKRRILVDEGMLERSGRGDGASFDTDREVFVAMSDSPLESHDPIRPIDFDIRATDFKTTVEDRFARTVTAAGYNPESVTWANSGQPMTATEVMSRDALSRDTTNAKRRYFTPALCAQAYKHLRIGKTLGGFVSEPAMPELRWPQVDDGDQAATADLINTLSLAGAISIFRKVQLANPEWDDEQVREEVQRIREDQGLAAPAAPTDEAETGVPDPEDLD